MRSTVYRALVAVAAGLVVLSGCGDGVGKFAGKPKPDAIAVFIPASGSPVQGTVAFAKTNKGVRVMARIDNLTPGKHGFHIHEFGDCSAPDAASAGGHFNPQEKPHGAPATDLRHAGDMGNLLADKTGRAELDAVFTGLTLEGPDSIIGRSVVVHADVDDLTSQPSGASGARLACGVIGFAAR